MLEVLIAVIDYRVDNRYDHQPDTSSHKDDTK